MGIKEDDDAHANGFQQGGQVEEPEEDRRGRTDRRERRPGQRSAAPGRSRSWWPGGEGVHAPRKEDNKSETQHGSLSEPVASHLESGKKPRQGRKGK